MQNFFRYFLQKRVLLIITVVLIIGCKTSDDDGTTPIVKPPVDEKPVDTDVAFWLTKGDKTSLFKRQNIALLFADKTNSNSTITVDTTKKYQSMVGFGYTLTGGSAIMIYGLPTAKRKEILDELFKTDSTFIGVSYLRLNVGASDLSEKTFTYDEMPGTETDEDLSNFSLDEDKDDYIPLIKEILAINPNIQILATPWTAPTWMKSNRLFKGGSLKPEYYDVYADYLVKYIKAMAAEGITIDALTPQNEPLHDGNVPSMKMLATEQAEFIKNSLGPAFETAGITTKIIAYDHNADVPEYPLTILNDAEANPFVEGSAFHLYGGNITALTTVHNAHPDKSIYFTEQYTGASGNFGGDLGWHMENLIIGAPRNWSRNVLEWNLAADPTQDPHTDGGCSDCLGALTISGSTVSRNVAYYIIAHASKFVRPGSVRVDSNTPSDLLNVAYQREDGKKVLIVFNKSSAQQTFNIKFKEKIVTTVLSGGSVGTYVW